MVQVAVIDEREITITPVFKMIEVENIPKSEHAGHLVMETKEVVEVRFAGSRHYSPVFPADAMAWREGNRIVTYAERWADQYRAFKEGNPQEANGTPLEMLRQFGVTPEQLSLCRVLKIYSIEALHHLEGQNAKSLGVHQNKLKEAAARFMADRSSKGAALSEIDALNAKIEELKAQLAMVVPAVETPPAEIEALLSGSAEVQDSDIKDEIERLTGTRPRGNPSRATLETLLQQAQAA